MSNSKTKFASPALGVVFGVFSAIIRPLPTLLPNMLPWNFSPMGGLALYCGGRMRSWLAFGLPIVVMLVTDFLLSVLRGTDYSPLHSSRIAVYVSFLFYVLLGRTLTRTNSPLRIGATAVLGSLQFFLITNFAAWLDPAVRLTMRYDEGPAGILQSYVAGLTFYGNNLLADLVFTGVFFGIAWAYSAVQVPQADSTAETA